jgi:hypothetical protein
MSGQLNEALVPRLALIESRLQAFTESRPFSGCSSFPLAVFGFIRRNISLFRFSPVRH